MGSYDVSTDMRLASIAIAELRVVHRRGGYWQFGATRWSVPASGSGAIPCLGLVPRGVRADVNEENLAVRHVVAPVRR